MILVVTQLTAPAASLANPFDQTWLVRALDRSIASTRAQQLPLKKRDRISEPPLLPQAWHSMAQHDTVWHGMAGAPSSTKSLLVPFHLAYGNVLPPTVFPLIILGSCEQSLAGM